MTYAESRPRRHALVFTYLPPGDIVTTGAGTAGLDVDHPRWWPACSCGWESHLLVATFDEVDAAHQAHRERELLGSTT